MLKVPTKMAPLLADAWKHIRRALLIVDAQKLALMMTFLLADAHKLGLELVLVLADAHKLALRLELKVGTDRYLLLKVAAAAVRVAGLFVATSESSRLSSLPGRNLVGVEGSTRVVAATKELSALHAGNIALYSNKKQIS